MKTPGVSIAWPFVWRAERVRAGRGARKYLALCAGVVLCAAAFGTRLAPRAIGTLNDDAVEYINIARHLAGGDGYVISLKWHCFDSRPVVRPAWGERLPGAPVLLAAGLALDGERGMRAVTAFAFAALLAIFIILVAKEFSARLAFLGALLVLFNPNLAANAADFMSEVFFLPLVVAGFFLLGREKPGALALVTGVLFAAAALIRYEALPLFLLSLWFRPRRERLRGALLSTAAFAAAMSPYWYVNYVHNGSPFYALHFAQTWGLDAGGYSRSLRALAAPTTLAFIPGHVVGIAVNILRNFYNYAKELAGYKFLSLFAPFLFFAAPARRQRRFLAAAIFIFLFYSFSWSAMNLQRFMLVPYTFLVPFGLVGFENVATAFWRGRKRFALAATFAAYGVVLFLYAGAYYADVRDAARNPVWDVAGYGEAAAFLRERARDNAAVMTTDAWELNWETGAPAAVLPRDADYGEAAAWGKRMGVRYILAGPGELSSAPRATTTFGEWRVFDLGAAMRPR